MIRASAHQALQDLREVIGVLREDDDAGGAPERAAADAGRPAGAGRRVARRRHARDAGRSASTAARRAGGTGRTAYRIVQEGLTNARKHAPGHRRRRRRRRAAPGDGLTVEVRNPPAGRPRGAAAIPGAGTGLVGLAERAALAGGRLEHGRTDAGEFRLSRWLPWPA